MSEARILYEVQKIELDILERARRVKQIAAELAEDKEAARRSQSGVRSGSSGDGASETNARAGAADRNGSGKAKSDGDATL